MNYTPYVWCSQKPYLDYLQDRHYLEDLNNSNKALALDIRKDLRELAFDKEYLLKKGFEIMQLPAEELREINYGISDLAGEQAETREVITKTLDSGIERISYSLDTLKQNFELGMSELNGTFQWCCSNLLSELKGMKASISELIKAVKSPMQTAALEHFRDARTAFKNELYPEAMEELQAAINGVPGVSAGYKMEWRVYQLLGLIRLGFDGCDISLVNLAEAEDNFLKAARYAKAQNKSDVEECLISAGWAAYCQGNFDTAIAHLKKALEEEEELKEAWFLLGKAHGAKKEGAAFECLRRAAKRDPFYVLKAIADEDYTWDEKSLKKCIDQIKQDYYDFYYEKITDYLSITELRGIKGFDKEVKAICKASMLKDWQAFRREFDPFLIRINDYTSARKQQLPILQKLKGTLRNIADVVAHQDFPLWGIDNKVSPLKDCFQKLQAEYNKNDYGNPDWSTFDARLKKLCSDVYTYQMELREAVEWHYTNLILPYNKEISILEERIEKITDKLEKVPTEYPFPGMK